MTDTNTLDSVQPATADLLVRTAESKGVTVDLLLQEMLVVYTSVELQQTTADLQRVLRGERSSEGTDKPEPDPACPYCRCSNTVNMAGSFEGFDISCCSNVYCPLNMFAETESEIQDGNVRIVAEIIDLPA